MMQAATAPGTQPRAHHVTESAIPKRSRTVFSADRSRSHPLYDELPQHLKARADAQLSGDGLTLLQEFPQCSAPLVLFDPQYRGVMDRLSYGNEGTRQKGRAALAQMSDAVIRQFIAEISRVLTPSGHMMLWVDKFHLAEAVKPWLADLPLSVVDVITWDKDRIGMGYRSRRKSEYLVVVQKLPLRAKGCWTSHDIPDTWREKVASRAHPHAKPEALQSALIAATTAEGDFVLDPCAGGFSVLRSALAVGRHFIGTDVRG